MSIHLDDIPVAQTAAAPKSRVALFLSFSAGAFLLVGGIGANSWSGNNAAGDASAPHYSVRRRAQEWIDGMTSEDAIDGNFDQLQVETEEASTIDTIALIGERHSGTNWITDHLQSCFGDELNIHVSYSRFKHWFQYDKDDIRKDSHVVVAMFRDPYDWTEAMRERPHHAHDHIGLTWRDFVTYPWVGRRGFHDEFLIRKARGQERVINYAGSNCYANYTWNEVVPCSMQDSIFVEGYARYMYELNHDGSGKAYPSIVDLRRAKILNFLTIPAMKGVKHFYPYRYEDMNRDGTAELIGKLEVATGKKAKCKPFPATGKIKHKRVDRRYIQWMNQNVDWEVEGMIGYTKRQP